MGSSRGKPRDLASYVESLRSLLEPLVRVLTRLQVGPDTLTALGWAFSTAAAVLFGIGYIKLAGAVVLLAGLFDTLDGAVARRSDRMSTFGAFLDSTLDRFSESAIFVGIIFFYATSGSSYGALLAGIAISFSLLTSYTRARAEGWASSARSGYLSVRGG